MLCLYVLVLVVCSTSVQGQFRSRIVVVRKSGEYRQLSDVGNNQSKPVTFTTSVPVTYLNENEVFKFWQESKNVTDEWLVVVDPSTEYCPSGVLQTKTLGYVTTGISTCNSLPDQVREQATMVRTVSFEYKTFLSDMEIYTNASTDSLALMYDDSGKDHQRQRHLSSAGILFQLDIPILNCNIENVLKNLAAKTEVKVIFAMATSYCQEVMLQVAYRLDMLRGRYRWVMLSTDGRLPHCDVCTEANVVILVDTNPAHNVVNTGIEEKLVRYVDSVLQTLVTKLSEESVTCSVGVDDVKCRKIFKELLQKIGTNSSLGVFTSEQDQIQEPTLLDIYRYNGLLHKIGQWVSGQGIISQQQIFLSGDAMVVLRVAVVVEPPFVFRNNSETEVTYHGYSIDVMNDIASRIGFTYTVRECDGGIYGSLESNERWSGCIGNIIRGDADIIVGAMTVTAERETVVDYTLPYYDFAGIQILMKKQKQKVNIFYFAEVFTNSAWLCLGGVIALTSILLLLFDRYSPGQGFSKATGDPQMSFNLHESIWFIVGSVTMAGGGEPPKSFSARLLVAGFWFFTVIMMSTFTANLAAFLTVSRLGVTISSLDELSAQSDIKYSTVLDSSVTSYFERMATIEENFYTMWKEMSLENEGNSNLAVWDYPLGDKYVTIWKAIQKTGLVKNSTEAINKVKNENFALITDSPIIKYITSRNCDLTAIGAQFSVRPYAFALKEKSVFTKKISAAILELQQDRMLEAYKRKWWDDGKVSCPEDTSDQGLDLESLTGSFLVVVMGIVSGVLVLIVELLWIKAKLARKEANTCILEVKPTQSPVVTFTGKQKPEPSTK